MTISTHASLEALIRSYILLGRPSAQGFEGVKCAKCNDYKTRGGFKFEDRVIRYVCFNCSTKAQYDESYKSISHEMRKILTSFGIPNDEIDRYLASKLFANKNQDKESKVKAQVQVKALVEVKLPDKSVNINGDESEWCAPAREYLKWRCLYPNEEFNFYVSDDPDYVGRVIIPYMIRNRMIYWQARSLDDSIKPRYLSPSISKDAVLFNADELTRYTNEPLFVTEGALDSMSIGRNAIALIGSTLNEHKEKELIKASQRRKIIFIIDKNLNGYQLGMRALKHENFYVVCFPDNIEDANDALKKYGKLWLLNYITSNAVRDTAGKVLLELRCDKSLKK